MSTTLIRHNCCAVSACEQKKAMVTPLASRRLSAVDFCVHKEHQQPLKMLPEFKGGFPHGAPEKGGGCNADTSANPRAS